MNIVVFGKQVRCFQAGCGDCAGMWEAMVQFGSKQFHATGKTPEEVKAKLEAKLEASARGWKI